MSTASSAIADWVCELVQGAAEVQGAGDDRAAAGAPIEECSDEGGEDGHTEVGSGRVRVEGAQL